MSEHTTNNLVEVFAGNIIEAGLVRTLLENAEITAFLKDEIMGTLNPWWVAGGGAGAVSVIVSAGDFEKAKLIVDDFEKQTKTIE